MIDVNMLPRELTGYVGHVCGLWFGSYFIDFEPVFVHSTAGIIGELYEYLVDTVQDNSMNGGLDYEDAEEYAKLAATVPWSMEEIDRVAEQSFPLTCLNRTLQVLTPCVSSLLMRCSAENRGCQTGRAGDVVERGVPA